MSNRLPALSPRDVLRVLQREGFYLHHATGSHYYWKHPGKHGLRVTPPSIIDQAGYTVDEFAERL